MKKFLGKIIGNLLIASGLGIYVWLWTAAMTTGRGLQLKVTVLGTHMPAMIPIWTGLGLIVFGLVIGYGRGKRNVSARSSHP